MASNTTPRRGKQNTALEEIDALAIGKSLVSIVETLTASATRSSEPRSLDPRKRADELAYAAAMKAAAISGGLSLPPGPLGLLTIVPELLAIWKLQDELVNDIAAAFGKSSPVQKEKLLYCLFKNMTCQIARDVAVRTIKRVVIRRASASVVRRVLWRCGIPIIGAAGAAAYTWYDTMQVARRAVKLFGEQQLQLPALEQKEKVATHSPKKRRQRKDLAKKSSKVIAMDSRSKQTKTGRRKTAVVPAVKPQAKRLRPAA